MPVHVGCVGSSVVSPLLHGCADTAGPENAFQIGDTSNTFEVPCRLR
jgi:hypothetical protein